MLQVDDLRFFCERMNRCSATFQGEHGHRIIINRIHGLERTFGCFHHGDAGFAARIFFHEDKKGELYAFGWSTSTISFAYSADTIVQNRKIDRFYLKNLLTISAAKQV